MTLDRETSNRSRGSTPWGAAVDNMEALVTSFDKRKRDLIMTSSPSLANKIVGEGRPTMGLRLEIQQELDYTFRLLTRFGARLRARHGPGTKRHIKFDDFTRSLFANVKLPGDPSWTRVTAAMAREDMDASIKEEGIAKLVPVPRERLGRPMITRVPVSSGRGDAACPVARPSGKRPHWLVPDRGPHT